MTRATPLQIEAACRTRSADAATAYLLKQGLQVRRSQCSTMISRLIARKERKAMANPLRTFAGMGMVDVTRYDAERGSRKLLAAHLLSGQHYIHDQRQMDDARKAARL